MSQIIIYNSSVTSLPASWKASSPVEIHRGWRFEGRHKRISNHSLVLTCHALPSLGNWPPGIGGVVRVCHWVCLCVPKEKLPSVKGKESDLPINDPPFHHNTHQTGCWLNTHSQNDKWTTKYFRKKKAWNFINVSISLFNQYNYFTQRGFMLEHVQGYDALTQELCSQSVWGKSIVKEVCDQHLERNVVTLDRWNPNGNASLYANGCLSKFELTDYWNR